MGEFRLSAPERETLAALCRRIAPGVANGGPPDLAAAVEARLAAADLGVARRLARLLRIFDHPATALAGGKHRRFSRLPATEQEAWLRRWEKSRLPLRRTIFQALRRLVLSTFYADPAAQRAIGFLGPYHAREPVLAWEGPLPGEPNDAEPVARGGFAQARPAAAIPSAANPSAPIPTPAVPTGVFQGRDLGDGATIRAGVCVVGSGAGGAVTAARLAEAGHDVAVLEAGSFWTAADFTEDEAEMTPRLFAEAGGRATEDLSISILQGRAVGGGTVVNWMLMLRTPAAVLEEWAAEHGTEGMRPADLAPVFDLVEAEVHARPVPADAHSPSNLLLLEGARRLGWRARSGSINARGCVRAGSCSLGCRHQAKQSALVTYIPRALSAGARLYSDASADRIEVVGRGGKSPLKRITATLLDRTTGRPRGRVTVEAPLVVLAAGAVETPALLQRSGLGGGGVGRFLSLHPTTAVVGRYGHEVYQAAGIPLSTLCDEPIDRSRDGYGAWIECPPFLPALASIAVPGFGAPHREVMERLRHLAAMIVLVRDGADRRRSNGSVSADRSGRPRIRYRLGRTDRRNLLEGMRAAARLHFAAGAEEVLTLHAGPCRLRSLRDLDLIDRAGSGPNRLGLLSAHVNGTCRIGSRPRSSGCTPDGERHGVPGLYVADGSLLPTAPGVNPQETIMALATVVARRIAERHPSG